MNSIQSVPQDSDYQTFSPLQLVLKRIVDIVVAGILLVLTSPLWLLIMLWIRLDSPGGAIFTQTRVGLRGMPFKIYKFRTMVQNAEQVFKPQVAAQEDMANFVFQHKGDPRITRSGRFLRKTSLDELPQLLNILNGSMSLVGPRPEVPEITEHYTAEQRQRLSVLPGVTGLAQINGRSELNLGETLAFDVEYVRNWSFGYDLKILGKTFAVVFTGKGAY